MTDQDHAVRYDNKELLAQARAGDDDALSALILNHDALILRTVGRVIKESGMHAEEPDLIDTTAHDVSLLATHEFEQFSGSYPQLRHWLRVISRQHALRIVRREKAAEHVDEFGYMTVSPAQMVDRSVEKAEQHVDLNNQASTLLALEQCLERLHEDDTDLHQLIWLKYRKSWSDQQIQTFLEDNGNVISVPEVSTRIKQGRELLGEYLRDQCQDG